MTMNDDYNTSVNSETLLQDVLRSIPQLDVKMLRWKASNAHRITSLDLDESERALAEWAQMCECKGGLLRLAESLYPNKAICTAIGYDMYCSIRAEIRRIDRFRGCYGLDENTKLMALPYYARYYDMSDIDRLEVAYQLLGDISPTSLFVTRRIILNWMTVQHKDRRRVEWDYDSLSNTLFVRSR